MEPLIDYEFTPKIDYYFKYEVDIDSSKEKIIQVTLLEHHIEEKNNIKTLVVDENTKKNLIKEQKLGYFLKNFLNIYQHKLKNTLNEYKNELTKATKFDRLDNGEILSINLLRNYMYSLEKDYPEISPFLNSKIINCLWFLEYHIPKYKQSLSLEMEMWKKAQNFDEICENRVNSFKEQIHILENTEFYNTQCLKCINSIIKEVKNVVSFWDNLFETTGNNNRTKIFKGCTLSISNCKVEYKTDNKHPKAKKYIFKVHSLIELSNISIFMFDKVKPLRIITKCKNCGDYFIPRKNNDANCDKVIGKDKNGNNITCKVKAEDDKFGNNKINEEKNNVDSSTYYHRIYNRLVGKQQDEFKNGYDDICDKYKNDKEKLKIEKIKYLKESNLKYRNNTKNKRGRPYKDIII